MHLTSCWMQGRQTCSTNRYCLRQEYQEAREELGQHAFRVGMGAESIKELLQAIDLEKEYAELQAGLEGATGQKRARIVKRLEVVEAFRESGNKPEWMMLTDDPGHSAGSASDGTAGWWTFCHI